MTRFLGGNEQVGSRVFFYFYRSFQKVTVNSRCDSKFFQKSLKHVTDISKVSFLSLFSVIFILKNVTEKVAGISKVHFLSLIFEKILEEFS